MRKGPSNGAEKRDVSTWKGSDGGSREKTDHFKALDCQQSTNVRVRVDVHDSASRSTLIALAHIPTPQQSFIDRSVGLIEKLKGWRHTDVTSTD